MIDWPEILRRYGPQVWRNAYRLLGSNSDAQDVFQEAFLAAYEVSQKQAIKHWSGLLNRVTVAKSLDCLRRRYARRREATPLIDFDPADPRGTDPSESAARSELADGVRAMLADLDPREADVVCLVSIEGMSYREAGELLGISKNHVGVLLHRAKAELRARLQPDKTTNTIHDGDRLT